MAEKEGLTLVVFSGDKDKVLAALMMASGALAMGQPVTLFFTFWGISLLRKKRPQAKGKLFVQKIFGYLLPKGTEHLPLSRLNFLGIGSFLMNYLLKKKKLSSISDLLKILKEGGTTFYICSTCLEMLGIQLEELEPFFVEKQCGAAKFIEIAMQSGLCLFI